MMIISSSRSGRPHCFYFCADRSLQRRRRRRGEGFVVEGSAPSPSIPFFRAAWSPRLCSLFMFQCGWTDRQSKLLPQSERPSPVLRHAKSMKIDRTLCLAPLGFCLSLSLSVLLQSESRSHFPFLHQPSPASPSLLRLPAPIPLSSPPLPPWPAELGSGSESGPMSPCCSTILYTLAFMSV
jgi:hypothetical protein